MCPTKHFLNVFLANRGLEEPDARRLHRYNCDNEEYRNLRRVLRGCEDIGHLRRPLEHFIVREGDDLDWNEIDEADVMACFVLYASEWCRRRTVPPRRTWGRLFLNIRWDSGNYPELYPAIEHGLRRWGRPVIRMAGGARYFDTIAHEGGAGLIWQS